MLFEFIVGVPPFNDETVEKIFENIKEMRIPWDEIQGAISEDAEDLIRRLLEPDTSKRLNAEQIKKHKFFEGLKNIIIC
jgi:serine/threonine protein kinase